MRTLYYPEMNSTPAVCEIGLILDASKVVILARSKHLLNSDSDRDAVLNRVLENEVCGIRWDYIRFIVVLPDGEEPCAREFSVGPDMEDVMRCERAKHPIKTLFRRIFRKPIEIHSGAWVAGTCRFQTDYESMKVIETDKVRDLLVRAGLD